MSALSTSSDLRALLHRIVAFGALVPAAASAACGGSIVSIDDDGGSPPTTVDAGRDGAVTVRDASVDAKTDGGVDPRCAPRLEVVDGGGPFGSCSNTVLYACGVPASLDVGTGTSPPAETCKAVCEPFGQSWGCAVSRSTNPSDPSVRFGCFTCVEGRRPAGYVEAALEAPTLGALFAHMAALEAASVVAFEALRDELAFHGAPSALVQAADASAADERRHTRAMRRLARRFGGAPERVKVARTAPRSVEEIAVENAVEGCVRETYGALVALWQASHAEDRDVRFAMQEVARDETRHAELAWAVAAWVTPLLDEAARARVAEAQRATLTSLAREVTGSLPEDLVAVAGLPSAENAERLVRELSTHLLAA